MMDRMIVFIEIFFMIYNAVYWYMFSKLFLNIMYYLAVVLVDNVHSYHLANSCLVCSTQDLVFEGPFNLT